MKRKIKYIFSVIFVLILIAGKVYAVTPDSHVAYDGCNHEYKDVPFSETTQEAYTDAYGVYHEEEKRYWTEQKLFPEWERRNAVLLQLLLVHYIGGFNIVIC